MKTFLTNIPKIAAIVLILSPVLSMAQTKVANLRAYDQSGINVFEAAKDTNAAFENLKVQFGAGFTQSFQNLKHSNANNGIAANNLYKISPGFNTANANLYMNVQLAEGIRLNLTSYLSSRHHNETWVKGGYIQFDKLPFKGQVWDNIMKITTIKVGHMEINYGDQHFRRSDGGHTLYNPFVENYIVDAFNTEIGGEILVRKNNFFGMAGITNGMIKGNIDSLRPTAVDANIHKSPAFLFKGGYDKQLNQDLRVRVSASYYTNKSSGGNTLYAGDRTGSNYFMVMEKEFVSLARPANAAQVIPAAAAVPSSAGAQFTSGRFNPNFRKQVDAFMLNGFAKYQGIEFFGTYERAKGRTNMEKEGRDMTQIAAEGVYRFGKSENLFVAARYNTVKSEILVGTSAQDIQIDRTSFAAGWFLTKTILLKGEYVTQQYKDFATTDYRNGGKFNGYVIQAVVGF